MKISSMELQKAVYKNLSEGEYDVYEVVPPDTAFPYITIGEETVTTANTKTSNRTVHLLTIHTWSKSAGSMQSKFMNAFVMKTLQNKELVLEGFLVDIVSLELLTTYKEQATDNTIFHGVLQFEITLTEV